MQERAGRAGGISWFLLCAPLPQPPGRWLLDVTATGFLYGMFFLLTWLPSNNLLERVPADVGVGPEERWIPNAPTKEG